MRHMISCLVANRPGVLARIAKSFGDRNINIHSLAVNESEEENVSRLTIEIEGEVDQLEAIAEETARLEDVIEVEDLDRSGFVDRELMLAKVNTKPEDLPQLMQILEVMGAKVSAMKLDTMTVEMTGTEEKVTALIRMLVPFGIIECARSGRVAVSAGEES
ncbi:MAG: acetolactate synthase small subunit [Planctomycetota bacterium]